MYKNIKRQIKDQTREQLNHVFVPQQPGTIFTDSGSRATVTAGVLRFNRKLFILQRLENYLPNKPNFELYGGNYIYSTMNSNTDGSLNDSFLPQFANIEYSTSFIPSKDGNVYLPYELSDGSLATVYVIKNDNITGPTHILSKPSGKISIDLVSGEQIKIFIYYYNSNSTENSYGYIKILQGLADFVGSWAYIDVTPPSTPIWHDVPLVTQAADENASTTSVTLQLKAPVLWPDPNEDHGILLDPDIAGHNIYRVISDLATNGGSERGDENEVPQTIVYSGNILNKFIHGTTVTSENTASFLAKYNDSAIDEFGSTLTISGNPRYRSWANLGETNNANYVSNSNLSGVHGYPPSGWSIIGTGIVVSRYSDGRLSYLTEIKCTGVCGLSQSLTLANSRKHRLDFSAENITDSVSTVYLYKGSDIINSFEISGIGRVDKSIEFTSPLLSGVTLKYIVNSGIAYAYYFDVYDIEYERAIECCSQVRNYLVNGGFENEFSGWSVLGNLKSYHLGNSLFGYKSLTLNVGSGAILLQNSLFSTGSATTSVYINLYSGSLNLFRIGGSTTTISGPNTWTRHVNYSSSGTNAVAIQATSDAVFSVDGFQLESGRNLTCFDDINQDGTSTRSAAYVNYSGVNINNNLGTIRMWFHPSWKSGDAVTISDQKYLFVRGSGTDVWLGNYNLYNNMFEFTTVSGGSFSQIGVPYTINSRHENIHLVYSWSGTNTSIWVNGVKGTIDPSYTLINKTGCLSNKISIGGAFGLETKCADGTIDSFLIDNKQWSPKEILADYQATDAAVNDSYVVIGTNLRKANLIPNSNFSNRTSLSGILGWGITNSGNTTIVADYSNPKSSDVALKITTT